MHVFVHEYLYSLIYKDRVVGRIISHPIFVEFSTLVFITCYSGLYSPRCSGLIHSKTYLFNWKWINMYRDNNYYCWRFNEDWFIQRVDAIMDEWTMLVWGVLPNRRRRHEGFTKAEGAFGGGDGSAVQNWAVMRHSETKIRHWNTRDILIPLKQPVDPKSSSSSNPNN